MNKIKGTNWQSQQGDSEFSLQFETDNKAKYKFVEKAAQMAVDGKHTADIQEVVRCGNCKHRYSSEFCECRPADAYCSDGEKAE